MKECSNRVKYSNMLLLYIGGSLFGVLIEGLFCCIKYGRWETHVVSMICPLCIIYGIGAVAYYIEGTYFRDKNIITRFLIFAVTGTAVEFAAGWILEHFLKMYAWDYTDKIMNYHGYVCLDMSVIWGIAGLLFYKLVPWLNGLFQKSKSDKHRILNAILTAIIVLDLVVTFAAIARWAQRHNNVQALTQNKIVTIIDSKFNDEFMEKRFIEWHFLEDKAS